MVPAYTKKVSQRARSLGITVRPDGEVVVSAPQWVNEVQVAEFFGAHTEWVRRHVERARRNVVVRLSCGEYAALKKRTQMLVEARCPYFAARLDVSYRKITVRMQKSRWGSCSAAGNLNFSTKLAGLPSHLSDYVVVHELCHLREMNHSRKFWDLVAAEIPDYKKRRMELRQIHFMVE